MCRGAFRTQSHGFAQRGFRSGKVAQPQQCGSQVIGTLGHLRVDRDRFPESRLSLAKPPQAHIDLAQRIERRGLARRQFHGPVHRCERALGLTGRREGDSQRREMVPANRLALRRLLVKRKRLLRLSDAPVRLPHFEIRLAALRTILLDRPLEAAKAGRDVRLLLDLGDREIDLILRRPGQRRRIVERYIAGVRRGVAVVLLLHRLRRCWASRDKVIGDHDVDGVGGPAARHVTSGAVRRCGLPAVARQSRLRAGVTPQTGCGIMADRVVPARRLVRIVAGRAGERSAALEKAARFAQAIGRADKLELVVVTGAGRMVEMEHVVGQRLAGPVGEHAAALTQHRRRKLPAGRLQVALHADL